MQFLFPLFKSADFLTLLLATSMCGPECMGNLDLISIRSDSIGINWDMNGIASLLESLKAMLAR